MEAKEVFHRFKVAHEIQKRRTLDQMHKRGDGDDAATHRDEGYLEGLVWAEVQMLALESWMEEQDDES